MNETTEIKIHKNRFQTIIIWNIVADVGFPKKDGHYYILINTKIGFPGFGSTQVCYYYADEKDNYTEVYGVYDDLLASVVYYEVSQFLKLRII